MDRLAEIRRRSICLRLFSCQGKIFHNPVKLQKKGEKNEEKHRTGKSHRTAGVTRAKERLFITYVGNKKGKPVSRFVRELQLKESGRAKTVKKNDMVRHKTYGVCMVLSVNGNKCTIRSLSDDRDAEVLVSSLDIR